jgi:hypothetical protein
MADVAILVVSDHLREFKAGVLYSMGGKAERARGLRALTRLTANTRRQTRYASAP